MFIHVRSFYGRLVLVFTALNALAKMGLSYIKFGSVLAPYSDNLPSDIASVPTPEKNQTLSLIKKSKIRILPVKTNPLIDFFPYYYC